MKKLFFVAVAFAAISLTSCKNNSKPAANAGTTKVDTTKVDSTTQDSANAQVDTTANAQADTTAQK